MKQPCGNNDRVHSQPQVEKAVTVWENLEFDLLNLILGSVTPFSHRALNRGFEILLNS